MRRLPTVLALLAAVALGDGIALNDNDDAPHVLHAGTALPEPRALPEFAFTDQAGRPVGPEDFAGHWSLVFTGFTHCPDVCPTTLALMAELRRRLEREDLRFVFVSVDPERDTPEAIARYVAHFDPMILGLTGPRAEMERFTAGLGLAQVRNPGVDGDYTVDHSTAFVLINPDGRLAGYFQAPHGADALTADLAGLRKVDGHP
jgi:protein SCO1/2